MGYAERVWTAVIHETMPVMKRRAAVAVAKSADAEIAALRADNERLRKREATLFEMVKRCERDVQRALRKQSAWENHLANLGSLVITHDCRFRTACEAIQQRAAGVGEPKEVE